MPNEAQDDEHGSSDVLASAADPRRSSGWPPTPREWKFFVFSLILMAFGLFLCFLIILGTVV